MGRLPFACAVITAIQALVMVLVTFGNISDFGTNEAFVRHVLAMDTTNFGQPAGQGLDPDVMWRAIGSPALQRAAYVLIVIWESLTAIVLVWATIRWARGMAGTATLAPARRAASLGFLMVVAQFFGGFIAIGGEWFQMWRSEAWNGLDAAVRYAMLALLGLVLVHLPSRDWGEPTG